MPPEPSLTPVLARHPATPPHCCGFWPQRGHADRGPTVCHGLESPLPSARCRGRTGDEQWGRPGVSEFWILGPRTLIPGAATQAGLPVSSDTARALLPPASAARPFQPLGPFPPLPAGPARPRLSLAQTPKPPPASPATHGPPARSPEADSHARHHGCDLNSRSGLPLLRMLYGLSAA